MGSIFSCKSVWKESISKKFASLAKFCFHISSEVWETSTPVSSPRLFTDISEAVDTPRSACQAESEAKSQKDRDRGMETKEQEA